MNKIILAATAIVIAILVIIYANQNAGPKSNVHIRIGYLAIGAGLPLFVANDEGLFEQQGVQVELIEFKSSNDVAAAAIAGRIDIVGTGATNAMLDANSQTHAGFELFMVNNYVKRGNHQSTDFLFARKALAIQSVSDLRGKTIAIFPGSVGEVFAKSVLPQLGLDYNDAEFISMSPPQWLPSLQSDSIDAVAGAVEPFASMIYNSGVADVIVDGYYAELMPDVPASGAWFVNGKLERSDEEAVFAAFKSAVIFIETNPVESRKALLNYTSISEDLVSGIRLQDWRFTDDPSVEALSVKFAEIFFERGGISSLPEDNSWIWK